MDKELLNMVDKKILNDKELLNTFLNTFDEELLKMMKALNSGEITYREYHEWNYKRMQNKFKGDLLEARAAGDWEKFIHIVVNKSYEVMPIAFEYFEEIPDNLKYNFLIGCYEHHGDNLPIVREYVKRMREWGKPQLPDSYKSLESLIVYRAGTGSPEYNKKSISWTTDINIARFFYFRKVEKTTEDINIYQAQILKSDILAYNNNREEFEIMQYNSVYNIVDISHNIASF